MANRNTRGRNANRALVFPTARTRSPSAEIFPDLPDSLTFSDDKENAPVIMSPIKKRNLDRSQAPIINKQSDLDVWNLSDAAIISAYLFSRQFKITEFAQQMQLVQHGVQKLTIISIFPFSAKLGLMTHHSALLMSLHANHALVNTVSYSGLDQGLVKVQAIL